MASSSAAMKTTLVFMLLLGAAVAAHGRPVDCENKCPVPIVIAGVTMEVGVTAKVEVLDLVDLYFHDHLGVKLYSGSFSCPPDVKALVVVYEEGCVKVKVAAVGFVSKLLNTVVGLVLGLIECIL